MRVIELTHTVTISIPDGSEKDFLERAGTAFGDFHRSLDGGLEIRRQGKAEEIVREISGIEIPGYKIASSCFERKPYVKFMYSDVFDYHFNYSDNFAMCLPCFRELGILESMRNKRHYSCITTRNDCLRAIMILLEENNINFELTRVGEKMARFLIK